MTTGLRFQPVPGYLTVAGPRQKTATRRNRTGEAGKLSGAGTFSSGHALPQQTTRPRRAADRHGQPGARQRPRRSNLRMQCISSQTGLDPSDRDRDSATLMTEY